MIALIDGLAGRARPILLVVAGLLTAGATLTLMGLPLIGWPVYGVGYLGLLVALPALVAAYRASLDLLAWFMFAVLYVGVALSVPVLVTMWGHYAATDAQGLLLPYSVTPPGMLAAALAWLGLGLFGLAAYRVRALPTSGAIVLVIGAVLALLAEIGVLAPVMWTLGIVLVSFALVWIAPEEEVRQAPTG